MSNIYLTADTHFGHSAILQHCQRPFATVEEMDETLIANWNSTVGKDDVVWHLGDFAFRHHADYLARLNGKINLLLGNHDKFSTAVRQQFASVRELFYGDLVLADERQRVFLFHYPLVSWPKKFSGECIHFFGHVHGRYRRPNERALDVGVDVHNFKPLSLTQAISLATTNYEHSKKEIRPNETSPSDRRADGSRPEPTSGDLPDSDS